MNLTTGEVIAGVWWESTKKGYAAIYARGIRVRDGIPESSPEIDWAAVNKAIIERWSLSGLKSIKKMAWKIAESR